jgi:hypothetical protein
LSAGTVSTTGFEDTNPVATELPPTVKVVAALADVAKIVVIDRAATVAMAIFLNEFIFLLVSSDSL